MERVLGMKGKEAVKYEIINDFIKGEITRAEASRLLNITERAVTNRANKVRKLGIAGALHGNKNRSPKHKKDEFTRRRLVSLKKDKYFDFNVSHSLEKMQDLEKINNVSYSTLWRWCKEESLLKICRKRRKKVRQLRMRYASEGYFVQLDGSPHEWIEGETWTLISAIDDATSKILSAQFSYGETTFGCMKVLRQIIEKYGRPRNLYTDHAGIFCGKKRQDFSHFKASCDELNINIILASSPESKGRVERSYFTLQDRLVPEMRLAGIKTMQQAQHYLDSKFIPDQWNKKFTCLALEPETSYRPLEHGTSLRETLCIKLEREIKKNACISFEGVIYKLSARKGDPEIQSRIAFLRFYPDESWSVFVEGRIMELQVVPSYAQPDPAFQSKIRAGNRDLLPGLEGCRKRNRAV